MAFWRAFGVLILILGAAASTAGAQSEPLAEAIGTGATVAVVTPQRTNPDGTFITLSTGGMVLVRGQPFVVTQEPAPAAVLTEAPPPAPTDALLAPEEPIPNTIWVPGHWTHGIDGFVWVPGRSIPVKPGHAFVPPRWVFVGGRHLFFAGFFVPHRVWVRSFFNTFHFSGDPTPTANSATRDRGPYWPIGVSGRPGVSVSTARGRGPYWPIGLGPPTILNRRAGTVVGLPSNRR